MWLSGMNNISTQRSEVDDSDNEDEEIDEEKILKEMSIKTGANFPWWSPEVVADWMRQRADEGQGQPGSDGTHIVSIDDYVGYWERQLDKVNVSCSKNTEKELECLWSDIPKEHYIFNNESLARNGSLYNRGTISQDRNEVNWTTGNIWRKPGKI